MSFNADDFRTSLQYSVQRFKKLDSQKLEEVKKTETKVVDHLRLEQMDMAHFAVRAYIREKDQYLAFQIAQTYAEQLLEKRTLVAAQKDLPDQIKEAVASIIVAAHQFGNEYLPKVKDQLLRRYGKSLEKKINDKPHHFLHPRFQMALANGDISEDRCERELTNIAMKYDITIQSSNAPVPLSPPAIATAPAFPTAHMQTFPQQPPPTQPYPQPQPYSQPQYPPPQGFAPAPIQQPFLNQMPYQPQQAPLFGNYSAIMQNAPALPPQNPSDSSPFAGFPPSFNTSIDPNSPPPPPSD
ncbi:putative Regulator of Vps4 activity in the MVB pathway [Blattamonas nauphoetae]|uniref:Regulator of Vps4 activity in the MVB pathway n=1 Tax=Blattamonas nauphoetae TaxID=2049346 RepID=A0ABQ9X073_9EUKA|nr:putative Regulator of Vps4 activity in the MVB pathway [Blattamonas nauphoetae]